MNTKKDEKKSSFWGSLFILLLIIIVFGICIIKYKFEAHVPIAMSIGLLIVYGLFILNVKWEDMSQAMIKCIEPSLECMLIILMIGALIGTWIAAGIVPYMIALGLKVMSAKNFLVSALCICTIMSMCTGSSWTTMGTIGVAFMGVGIGLGLESSLCAGAIICGAYMGDTLSPLSDQTNFSSSIAGVDLYRHIKSMLYTTLPVFVMCLLIFYILGRQTSASGDMSQVLNIIESLEHNFYFSPVLLVPLVLIMIMILLKVPAFPTLLFSSCIGIIFSMIFQGYSFVEAGTYWYSGFVGNTGNTMIDSLLTRGGITSMWYTLALMMLSLAFAGLLQRCGIIKNLVNILNRFIKGITSLVIVQLVTGYILSFIASDPYLAMLLPSNVFEEKYEELGYDKTVLSRNLENGATVVAPMVPWGSNGVYCATALGISTARYLPYYFMGSLTPVICIIYCLTGIGMFKKKEKRK